MAFKSKPKQHSQNKDGGPEGKHNMQLQKAATSSARGTKQAKGTAASGAKAQHAKKQNNKKLKTDGMMNAMF